MSDGILRVNSAVKVLATDTSVLGLPSGHSGYCARFLPLAPSLHCVLFALFILSLILFLTKCLFLVTIQIFCRMNDSTN